MARMPGPETSVDTVPEPVRIVRAASPDVARDPARPMGTGRRRPGSPGSRTCQPWSAGRRNDRVPDPAREGPGPAAARRDAGPVSAARLARRQDPSPGHPRSSPMPATARPRSWPTSRGGPALRTLWYRLDEDDRDWISFLSHLVAAGRDHDPGFAPNTAALLSDLARGGPTRETATEVFLRELPAIAGAGRAARSSTTSTSSTSRRTSARSSARSWRAPGAAVDRVREPARARRSRWRACAPPARSPSSARTTSGSTRPRPRACSPRPTGGRSKPTSWPTSPTKTEGWAASLQLVQAALRDRTPAEIRQFVRGLSGADQELYDYLAEEVVGDLPEDLQQFLMRTSILQVVTTDLAAVVTDLDEDAVARHDRRRRAADAAEPTVARREGVAAVPPARPRVPRGAAACRDRAGW